MSSSGFASFYGLNLNALSTSTGVAGHATAATAGHVAGATAGHVAGGVALGGFAAVGLAAAVGVGAGIVLAKGMMWCGEKLEANYQEACRQWTAFENAARAESRANTQQVSNYLNAQLELLSASEFARAEEATAAAVNQRELEQAITRARAALVDQAQSQQDQSLLEQQMLAARLRAEIKVGHSMLPPQLIAEARQAVSGSAAEIQAMLERLEQAWSTMHNQAAFQKRTIQQTRQALTLVSARLRAIEALLGDVSKMQSASAYKRLHEIEDGVQEARDELQAMQPDQALMLAGKARKEADLLFEEVSTLAQQRWQELRASINEQLGVLDALLNMVEETRAIHMADVSQIIASQKADAFKQRIDRLALKARTLLQGNNLHLQKDFMALTIAVNNLKQEVFTEVKTGQQQSIAQIIQQTLTELGYQSTTGAKPIISIHGDITRVEVMASRTRAEGERDDKLISFDISRDGKVSYDFSGYVGAACLRDAQEVLAALHSKGVYLVDEKALSALQNVPLEQVLTEVLQQPQFRITAVQNKTQAELAEMLAGVLTKMGYPQVHTRSVGGSIELEAFEGKIGYRVVMSPEGEIRILKDAARLDVTEDASDPLAKASRSVRETSPEPALKEQKRRYMAPRKEQKLFN